MHYPNKQQNLVTLQDLPAAVRRELDGTVLPISLILNKSIEVFSCQEDRSIPLNLLKQGDIFGLFELFSPQFLEFSGVNISAGVRTAFMLPNVSDVSQHKKLVNIYNAPALSKSLFDHWKVFEKIANYRFNNRFWEINLLLFSNNWIKSLMHDRSAPWLALKSYLLEKAWMHAQHLVHRGNHIFLKKNILKAAEKIKVHVSGYTVSTIKQIILMQQGKVPGFQVTDGTENALPEAMIQAAYVEDYKLKNYLPVIMNSVIWSGQNLRNPLYYSVNLPTIVDAIIPDMKNLRRTDLLLQINGILNEINFNGSQYRYIHQIANAEGSIQRPEQVLSSDDRIQSLRERYPGKTIPATSTFMTGCIQIKKDSASATENPVATQQAVVQDT